MSEPELREPLQFFAVPYESQANLLTILVYFAGQ